MIHVHDKSEDRDGQSDERMCKMRWTRRTVNRMRLME